MSKNIIAKAWAIAVSWDSRRYSSAAAVPVQITDPPANTVAPSISGTQASGATLTGSDGTWTRSPTSYNRQWYRATTAGGTYSAISGATGATYVVAVGDVGYYIKFGVAATNIIGTASEVRSSATGAVVAADDPTALPLVQLSDIEYVGAFRAADNGSGLYSYPRALAFDPAGNGGAGSLFMQGLNSSDGSKNIVGEMTIPALVTSASSPSDLNIATNIQNVEDAANGLANDVDGAGYRYITGLLVKAGRLVVAFSHVYMTTGQTKTHLSRNRTLATTGDITATRLVTGPSGALQNPRMYAGDMCHVPTEWRTLLGGPMLTGWAADSIVSNASDGPAAGAFDAADLISSSTITLQPLLAYPGASHHMDGGDPAVVGTGPFPKWNWTSYAAGKFIPPGTRTLVVIGKSGIGNYTYSKGGATDPSPGDGESWTYDPADGSKGEHAYPYRKQVWLFDLNDLAAVKAGTMNAYDLQPYAYGALNTLLQGSSGVFYTQGSPDPSPDDHSLGGAAYDPLSRIAYTASASGVAARAIVHGFRINTATSRSDF